MLKIIIVKKILLRLIILILSSILFENSLNAIPGKYALQRKARKYTLNGKYEEAREIYKQLVEKYPERADYHYELGLNYFYYTEDQKALSIPHFEKALKYTKKDTLGEIYFLLAEAHHFAGNFNEAIENYQHFKRYIKSNKEGDQLLSEINYKIAQCYQGNSFTIASNKFIKILNLGSNINTVFSEYAPVISDDESILMFTSRRDKNLGGKKDYYDEKFYEDMYIARKTEKGFTPATQFSIEDKYVGLVLNTPKHDAVVSLSHDEKKLFTYKDEKLFISELQSDGSWSGPNVLDETINPKKGYQPHASLSADGNTLYFSSERKDGKGKLDLYRSKKQNDGTWGPAENLGDVINTEENEDSPFITPDGSYLYFSSKGHNSIGGYDIFRSKINSDGTFEKPENLGIPINSGADDIFYVLTKKGNVAYFASSRKDGLGGMDIYKAVFVQKPTFTNCELIVSNKSSKGYEVNFLFKDTLLLNKDYNLAADVKLEDLKVSDYYWNIDTDSLIEGQNIKYTFKNKGEHEIKLELLAENIYGDFEGMCFSKKVYVIDEKELESVKEIALKGNASTKGLKDAPDLDLKPIYYDFNKFDIRSDAAEVLNQNIAILKANPGVVIKLTSHTDSRGSAAYNINLSRKRAQAAVDYLVKNGVPRKQIVAVVALGEKELVNSCADGVECSEEQHQLNRRTEFKVIGKK
jgi:outer membrane protein OmpA-like peptidoglycan-associated protein/tetratricopeptide (TPR) repeat protein